MIRYGGTDFVDHGSCYGQGCFACGYKGRVETEEGRLAREEWEDGAYDRAKDDRMDRELNP